MTPALQLMPAAFQTTSYVFKYIAFLKKHTKRESKETKNQPCEKVIGKSALLTETMWSLKKNHIPSSQSQMLF